MSAENHVDSVHKKSGLVGDIKHFEQYSALIFCNLRPGCDVKPQAGAFGVFWDILWSTTQIRVKIQQQEESTCEGQVQ